MLSRVIHTSAGEIPVVFTAEGLYALDLPGQYTGGLFPFVGTEDPAWLRLLQEGLSNYFLGQAVSFSCPVDFTGYTLFSKKVLQAALNIPYGEQRSYRWLAEQAGSPRAARAAGQVMAKNRTPIVIPCHRVGRGDGSLGGYSGGAGWKEKLLVLENSERRG